MNSLLLEFAIFLASFSSWRQKEEIFNCFSKNKNEENFSIAIESAGESISSNVKKNVEEIRSNGTVV